MDPVSKSRLADWGTAAAVGLVALGSYFATLLPGIHHFGDTTKAQFLGKFLGMTHPTGYPLYIALTAPLSFVPVGSLAVRINAFSAVCGAGAVVLLYALLRGRGVRLAVSAVAALAFCFSRMAWSQAVIAEVYALNVLLFAAVLYCLSRFDQTKSARWFLAACAVYSVSFGNHLTMITLLPAFCVAVWWADKRVLTDWRLVGAMLLTVVLGASQYLYLFARSESDSLYLEYRVTNLEQLVDFVSGERYRRAMFAMEWQTVFVERIPRFLGQLVRDLGPLCVIAPLAFRLPGREERFSIGPVRTSLALAALGQLIWVIAYDIPDIEVYLIPCAWCVAALAGLAMESLLRAYEGGSGAGAKSGARLRAKLAEPLGLTLGVACLIPLILFNEPDHEKSKEFARSIAAQLEVLDHDAAIVNTIHYSPRMAYVYFIYAEGLTSTRNLHLAYSASPKRVKAYLEGKASLVDSHTKERLPPGLTLYVDSRGARAARWDRHGLKLSKRRHGLARIELQAR